ncbi:hypothetical protein Tcan_17636 [Toxocara canis]|uniref:Uncharacterized protein n=1 Tax=Toxocara canis TaxID=6265 RepID=A0A0B2VBI5_TOXCA|nr:hypothetical protein Tcan_17636 [Toxocara canis]
MPSEYARRTLNLINRHNLFCNTVTESEEELLRTGRAVKDAAFRALEAATMRARKVASDEGIIRFLSDKHSSTEVLFDAMKANRDLLPQCWICKDRENETHEEDADAFNSKACDAKLSPRSSEKRKRTESKTEEDNLTKGTKRETHAQSLHRPEESTHGLSSQGHQDHNRAASQFVEEFSLLPSNARPSHS